MSRPLAEQPVRARARGLDHEDVALQEPSCGSESCQQLRLLRLELLLSDQPFVPQGTEPLYSRRDLLLTELDIRGVFVRDEPDTPPVVGPVEPVPPRLDGERECCCFARVPGRYPSPLAPPPLPDAGTLPWGGKMPPMRLLGWRNRNPSSPKGTG